MTSDIDSIKSTCTYIKKQTSTFGFVSNDERIQQNKLYVINDPRDPCTKR